MNNIKEKPLKKHNQINKKKAALFLLMVFVIIFGLVGYIYWKMNTAKIYIEDARILAPQIKLSSRKGGVLKKIFVEEGQKVDAYQAVAQVGYEIIETKTPGIIASVNNNIGEFFSPNQLIISMFNPADLRVVASIQEDKGLDKIKIGQKAYFIVDAFGSKKFLGKVETISPVSKESDIVFNISDKRQEKYFNIKIYFNNQQISQFKNGMSARVWIYK